MGGSSIHDHSRVDILIGHAIPMYEEVIEATIRMHRPHLVVQRADPDELGTLACRLQPALVICSNVCDVGVHCATSWAILYPNDRDEMILTTAQSSRTIPHIDITSLLDVLDHELGL